MIFEIVKQLILLFFVILLAYNHLYSQFSPPAGQPGSDAIHKDSSIFVGWATQCQVFRGYMDIQNPSLGYASVGQETFALGIADNSVVSLGDSGYAILEFPYPITNGNGPDFAVFENSFNGTFLELAFVEVSSDGQHFVRFPAISLTDTTQQVGGFGSLDATKIHHLAGKYAVYWGTPFDLEVLKDSNFLDINHITHVKILDVIGCITPGYRSYDSEGRPINDPYPTPFTSSGFDLDAVGVIHWNTQVATTSPQANQIKVFPTFFNSHEPQKLYVLSDKVPELICIYSMEGKLVHKFKPQNLLNTVSVEELVPGVYSVQVQYLDRILVEKILISE